MSTPPVSSSNHSKLPRSTLALAIGAASLVGVSLLAGAVLRGGGSVATVSVLAATAAALWLFVLFAERTGRGRNAAIEPVDAEARNDSTLRSAGLPMTTVERRRVRPESFPDLTFAEPQRRRDVSVVEDREHPGRISGTAQRLRVLLIDDEELVLRSTARLLEIRGYSVLTARDYTEALAVAEREPELLLAVTDVVLSGISGKEVVRALRQMHPRLRVVYVSGYDVASSGIHLATDGSEEFLPKPFAPGVLDSRLRALLGLMDRADEVVSIGA